MTRWVLRAECVGKTFWRNRVLSSASLRLPGGRITALLGRNGSGKTTLLRVAAGLLRADYGFVEFRERRYRRPRLSVLAPRGLFLLPDRGLLPGSWRVETALRAVGSRFRSAEEAEERAADGLARLDAGRLAGRRAGRLSDGERRLAALAAAWVRGPRCLLSDEPLRELSPASATRAARLLRALADGGAAVAVTGHRRRELLELADRVVWMTAGTTHDLGSPREAARHGQFRREYLGHGARPSLEE